MRRKNFNEMTTCTPRQASRVLGISENKIRVELQNGGYKELGSAMLGTNNKWTYIIRKESVLKLANLSTWPDDAK